MNPPRRDGFDAWPKKAPRRPGHGPKREGRRPFGQTWWGRAWVDAIEGRARLDPNRLPRGKTYARQGAVEDIHVGAGEVTASVQGSRRSPYSVRVRVRTFDTSEWATLLDGLAAQAGHAAAMLDGEIPPGVADNARAMGLDLLPGPGDVQPRCTCPDWADPCKHAAAVCYLVADRLDADPFLLLALRGRGRDEVLAGLRSRRAGHSTPDESGANRWELPGATWEADAGVPAAAAWARGAAQLPSLPAPARRPGRPVVLATEAPAESGVDTGALALLAADAARRAWDVVTGSDDSGLDLSYDEDLARWAAGALDDTHGSIDLETLASRAAVPTRQLFLQALAFRSGGAHGVAALIGEWAPPRPDMEAGRAALGAGARIAANRVTLGERQLRLGMDGRWYPYRKARGTWEPDGAPSETP